MMDRKRKMAAKGPRASALGSGIRGEDRLERMGPMAEMGSGERGYRVGGFVMGGPGEGLPERGGQQVSGKVFRGTF